MQSFSELTAQAWCTEDAAGANLQSTRLAFQQLGSRRQRLPCRTGEEIMWQRIAESAAGAVEAPNLGFRASQGLFLATFGHHLPLRNASQVSTQSLSSMALAA